MDIKIPKGMKSPTVVIVGQGTMTGDEKSNKQYEKRMDLLERKLSESYKKKIDNRDYTKEFASLQKSFIGKLDKFMTVNKQVMSRQNDKLVEALKKTVNQKISVIKETSDDDDDKKEFIKKISSLESAIRKISLKTNNVKAPTVKLDGAFEKLFARMENLIKSSKPRMYPSPS